MTTESIYNEALRRRFWHSYFVALRLRRDQEAKEWRRMAEEQEKLKKCEERSHALDNRA